MAKKKHLHTHYLDYRAMISLWSRLACLACVVRLTTFEALVFVRFVAWCCGHNNGRGEKTAPLISVIFSAVRRAVR